MPFNENETSQPTEEHHLVDMSDPNQDPSARKSNTPSMWSRHQTQIAIIIVGVVCFLIGLGIGAIIWHRRGHSVTEPLAILQQTEDTVTELLTTQATLLDKVVTTLLPLGVSVSLEPVNTTQPPVQTTQLGSSSKTVPFETQKTAPVGSTSVSSTYELLPMKSTEDSTISDRLAPTTTANITLVDRVTEAETLTTSAEITTESSKPATVVVENALNSTLKYTSVEPTSLTNSTNAPPIEITGLETTMENLASTGVHEATTEGLIITDGSLEQVSVEQVPTTKNTETGLSKAATRAIVPRNVHIHVTPKLTTTKSTSNKL